VTNHLMSCGTETPAEDCNVRKLEALMSDEDLWQLLGWHPSSPHDRGRILFPGSPDVWGLQSHHHDNNPSPEWIAWAKREILETGKDEGLYLCRMVRILEIFHCDKVTEKRGVEKSFLVTALMGAFAVADGYVSRYWKGGEEQLISIASQRHLVSIESVDEWNPGMASGKGWKKYVRLTLPGRQLLKAQDKSPPPPLHAPFTEKVSFDSTIRVEPPRESQATSIAPWRRVQNDPPAPPQEKTADVTFLRNEARDQWIYEECNKGTAYKQIVQQLRHKADSDGWEPIETDQGIIRAAQNYAAAKGLQRHPTRRRGRPKAAEN
jgi:hypothetical protein